MTLTQYRKICTPEELSPFWIGQGYGYKNLSLRPEDWASLPDDEIIYIPEAAYDKGYLELDDVYTKRDFEAIAGARACGLFFSCDWQTPEALWREWEIDDENEDGGNTSEMNSIHAQSPYRSVNELTLSELEELRDNYFWSEEYTGSALDPEKISLREVVQHFQGTSFVRDDFFCNQES